MQKYSISDVAEIISERVENPSISEYNRFVGLEHYDTGEVEITRWSGTEMITSAMKKFATADILLARRNVYLRRASVVNFEGVTSGDSIVLRIKDKNISSLMPFILNTNRFWDFADQYSDGTMSKRLSPNTLMEYEFTLPDNSEQERLSELLWSMNETKASYKRMLAATDELVKAQFIEMFVSKGYVVFPLKDICIKITDGTHKTPNYLSSGIQFLSAKNIIEGKLDFSDVKYISKDEYNEIQKRCQTEKGDIVLSKSGTLGLSAIVDVDFPFGIFESLAVLKTYSNQVNNVFLCEQLRMKNVQNQFSVGTKGIAVKHLHLNVIGNVKVIIPPLEFQNQFATFVKEINKSKLAIKQSLDSLEQCRNALMEKAFG